MGDENSVNQLLLSHPGMISLDRNGGKTALHYAVLGGHKKIINLLMQSGADINHSSITIGTPLHLAIKRNNLDILEYLFNYEIGQDHINTGLSYAVNQSNLKIIELLLAKGANINQSTFNLDSPLYLATQSGNLDIVSFLLKNGAKVNQRSFLRGDTALHAATFKNDISIAELLIHYGADVNSISYFGSTPLGLVHERIAYKKIEKLLLQYGATNLRSL
jgi:ankyrin repeat protein